MPASGSLAGGGGRMRGTVEFLAISVGQQTRPNLLGRQLDALRRVPGQLVAVEPVDIDSVASEERRLSAESSHGRHHSGWRRQHSCKLRSDGLHCGHAYHLRSGAPVSHLGARKLFGVADLLSHRTQPRPPCGTASALPRAPASVSGVSCSTQASSKASSFLVVCITRPRSCGRARCCWLGPTPKGWGEAGAQRGAG